MGQKVTYSYDDAAHVLTSVYTGGTNCTDSTATITYTADGLLASSASTTAKGSGSVATTTILATGKVCE
jgi:hypothetical protein